MGLFSGMFSGKSNRPDFTPDMMPKNRFELFFEMLKLNLFNLLKVNLMYFVFWIPFWIWTFMNIVGIQQITDAASAMDFLFFYLIIAAPCVMITGPAKCALKYITRNYARDEHVWLFSDFIDAIKQNWKQGLAMSVLNGVFLALFTICMRFYFIMTSTTGNPVYYFMQMLMVVFGVIYLLMNLYAWPMMVTYELKFTQVLRNSLVLAIGRLPQSVLFGLITIIPLIISGFWLPFLFWYFIIGYALASFVNCSYTNAAFDRFFNTRIEGAEVGRGMQKKSAGDDDEWEDLDPDDEDDE